MNRNKNETLQLWNDVYRCIRVFTCRRIWNVGYTQPAVSAAVSFALNVVTLRLTFIVYSFLYFSVNLLVYSLALCSTCELRYLSPLLDWSITLKWKAGLWWSVDAAGINWSLLLQRHTVFGRPYYRSCLWYTVSSVFLYVCLSVCRLSSVCLWRFVLRQNGTS